MVAAPIVIETLSLPLLVLNSRRLEAKLLLLGDDCERDRLGVALDAVLERAIPMQDASLERGHGSTQFPYASSTSATSN